MTLRSKLFAGDRALEAAQVSDPAHLVRGTVGPHVRKVQMALFALDSLPMDPAEFRLQTYGPVTARNVLSFKTRRKIINKAYQSAPDDIVGKMTITRLDEEMAQWEATHPTVDDCSRATRSAPAPRAAAALGTRELALAGVGLKGKSISAPGLKVGAKPQLNAVLRVIFAITKKAQFEDGFPLDKHLRATRDIIFEYGMQLSVEVKEGFADVIDFAQSIVLDEDRALLRQAWEVLRPGMPNVLRVLVAQGPINGDHGGTFRDVQVGSNTFRQFVVLNSRVQAPNHNTTLIHEMIHAAYAKRQLDHDRDNASVFFDHSAPSPGSVEQRVLLPERARALASAFYAFGGVKA